MIWRRVAKLYPGYDCRAIYDIIRMPIHTLGNKKVGIVWLLRRVGEVI